MSKIVPDEAYQYFEEDKETLNDLARIFYSAHGYAARVGHVFQASTHPQERQMFALACIASWYAREFGL